VFTVNLKTLLTFLAGATGALPLVNFLTTGLTTFLGVLVGLAAAAGLAAAGLAAAGAAGLEAAGALAYMDQIC